MSHAGNTLWKNVKESEHIGDCCLNCALCGTCLYLTLPSPLAPRCDKYFHFTGIVAEMPRQLCNWSRCPAGKWHAQPENKCPGVSRQKPFSLHPFVECQWLPWVVFYWRCSACYACSGFCGKPGGQEWLRRWEVSRQPWSGVISTGISQRRSVEKGLRKTPW